jgi:hypothetical protein
MNSTRFGPKMAGLALCIAFFATLPGAIAQFTVVGPPPYSNVEAQKKIRAYLASVQVENRKQTVAELTRLLPWYRDLIDDELIAAWHQQPDHRLELAEVIRPLATPRVASEIIDFAWKNRAAAMRVAYAPLFVHLMTPFPESARPMMDDLLRGARSRQPVDLNDAAAETLCRILLDMPDIGAWRNDAVEILPLYRDAARRLLLQDLRSDDQERRDRASYWLDDARSPLQDSVPGRDSSFPSRPRPKTTSDSPRVLRPEPTYAPSTPVPASSAPPASPTNPSRPTLATAPTESYSGPRSGTLECSGSAIPQNGEYVFRSLPDRKLQLDYDAKIWEARVAPGEGGTQRIILKNKSAGSQKRCTVRWSIVP